MVYIPDELVRNILSRLPAEPYLLRFRIVCREWKSIIDDPVFAKLQRVDMFVIRTDTGELYSMALSSLVTCSDTIQVNHIRHDTVYRSRSFLTSCRGFLLIEPSESQEVLALWNPFTKERFEFPFPPLHSHDGIISPNISAAGVGHDLATNDYIVVIPSLVNYRYYIYSVYSTKLRAWRRIKHTRRYNYNSETGRVVFAYGAFHWLAGVGVKFVLMSLDLTNETYWEIRLPCKNANVIHCELYAFDGCLFVASHHDGRTNDRLTLWTLQDYRGKKAIWWNKGLTLTENIPMSLSYAETLAYVKCREQILMKFGRKLMWFDVKKKKHVKTVIITGFEPDFDFDCQVLTGTRGADDLLELDIETFRFLDSSIGKVKSF